MQKQDATFEKQYCSITNVEKEMGNTKRILKPDYLDKMLIYFANREGLSGLSVVNSNPIQDPLSDLTKSPTDPASNLDDEGDLPEKPNALEELTGVVAVSSHTTTKKTP